MNSRQVTNIRIRRFKSIKSCDLNLGDINILIGSNGSGKSNFISLFRMLHSIIGGELQRFVSKQGGPNSLMYLGTKVTESMDVEFRFGNNGYGFRLTPTSDRKMMFDDEMFYWGGCGWKSIGAGHLESKWNDGCGNHIDEYVQPILRDQKWRVYHFHDTSDTASVKQTHGINDNESLSTDARNLAAFLFMLRRDHERHYNAIVRAVRMVAPYFDDFILRPDPENERSISLEWKDVDSDIPFMATQLSDGTLRFMCLATLLLQPVKFMPETIIIDEPELGLHPYAISILSELIKKASKARQIIISTQSVELLNEFSVEDIIVVDHGKNGSSFSRLNEDELRLWLEDDYTVGDLWKMNLFGGRPHGKTDGVL